MSSQDVKEIILEIEELSEDDSISKGVKVKLISLGEKLKDSDELSIMINKTIQDLEDICEYINIQPYARTKIWAIVSSLESLQH